LQNYDAQVLRLNGDESDVRDLLSSTTSTRLSAKPPSHHYVTFYCRKKALKKIFFTYLKKRVDAIPLLAYIKITGL